MLSSSSSEIAMLPEAIAQSRFDHQKWRHVLSETERQLQSCYSGITLIGPFGFELLFRGEFAPTNIKRLYVYTNRPESVSIALLSKEVQSCILFNVERIYPEILNDFILFFRNGEVQRKKTEKYICVAADKLLDIQVRDTNQPIIIDYAEYLILAYQSILRGIGECQNYKYSLCNRNRLFQLFLMQEALYSEYLPDIEPGYQYLIAEAGRFINNDIQSFFDTSLNEAPISEQEVAFMEEYVFPRSEKIRSILEHSSERATVLLSSESYHVKSRLSAQIGQSLYASLIAKVHNTYLNFI